MALAAGMLVTVGTCGDIISTSSTSLCKRSSGTVVKCVGDSGGVIWCILSILMSVSIARKYTQTGNSHHPRVKVGISENVEG